MCSFDGSVIFCRSQITIISDLVSCNTSDGDHREKVPPVPIPNTEVKLLIAEDTWLEAAREIRTLPSHH